MSFINFQDSPVGSADSSGSTATGHAFRPMDLGMASLRHQAHITSSAGSAPTSPKTYMTNSGSSGIPISMPQREQQHPLNLVGSGLGPGGGQRPSHYNVELLRGGVSFNSKSLPNIPSAMGRLGNYSFSILTAKRLASVRQAPGKRPASARQAPGKRPASARQAPGKRPASDQQAPVNACKSPLSHHRGPADPHRPPHTHADPDPVSVLILLSNAYIR
jgi:hypothetical protein